MARRAFALIAAVRLERALAGTGCAVRHHVIRTPVTLLLKTGNCKISCSITLCASSGYLTSSGSVILASWADAISIWTRNKSICTSAACVPVNSDLVEAAIVTLCWLSRRGIEVVVCATLGACSYLIASSGSGVVLSIWTFTIGSIWFHWAHTLTVCVRIIISFINCTFVTRCRTSRS